MQAQAVDKFYYQYKNFVSYKISLQVIYTIFKDHMDKTFYFFSYCVSSTLYANMYTSISKKNAFIVIDR